MVKNWQTQNNGDFFLANQEGEVAGEAENYLTTLARHSRCPALEDIKAKNLKRQKVKRLLFTIEGLELFGSGTKAMNTLS